MDKVPDIRDLEIQSKLNKLREKNEYFKRSDNKNNNNNNNNNNKNRGRNNFLPPPLPPPPPFEFFNTPSVPNVGDFLNNNVDDFNFPLLPPPPPPPFSSASTQPPLQPLQAKK